MTGGLLRPPDWTRDAACTGMAGAELDPWHDEDSPYAPIARAMCAACPVRLPCAVYALKGAIGHGIWGGLDPADRRRIARKHGYEQPGSAPHGTYSRYVTCRINAGRPCPPCRESKRRYMAERRAQQLEGRGPRPLALVEPAGAGRWRAWPGQLVLPGADTRGLTVAA